MNQYGNCSVAEKLQEVKMSSFEFFLNRKKYYLTNGCSEQDCSSLYFRSIEFLREYTCTGYAMTYLERRTTNYERHNSGQRRFHKLANGSDVISGPFTALSSSSSHCESKRFDTDLFLHRSLLQIMPFLRQEKIQRIRL